MAEPFHDVFALLFSLEVESIRLANADNGACRCLHNTVYENNPVLRTVILQNPRRISKTFYFFNSIAECVLYDIGWTAYLSSESLFQWWAVRISECSHFGLNIALRVGGRSLHVPCAEFLRRESGLWQRAKAERLERWQYGTSAVHTESAMRIQSARFSELFWAKLQLQIQHHLSRFHCFQDDPRSVYRRAYGRRLTVQELLSHIGIFNGHIHLNISTIPLLTSVQIPERRYWRHWWKYWKFWYEPSERNVVLGILTFSLYVTRVCDTCNQELETQGYRIHPECGVQRWRHIFGSLMWAPAASRDMRFIDVNTSWWQLKWASVSRRAWTV